MLAAGSLQAKVLLPGVFSDHMVLQREAPVPVWGWAGPGELISVEFAGQKKTARANADGRWMVRLDALSANTEPQDLRVSGVTPEEHIIIKDVLIGDVWLCSGQSNMEFVMGQLKDTIYADDLKTAELPLVRQGAVARNPQINPTNNTTVRWQTCTSQSVASFTAAGFYFAREVSKELGVPVGLLHSSWGGTSAESWTSESALDTVPDYKVRADQEIANLKKLPDQIKTFPSALAAWEKENGRADLKNAGEQNGWQKTNADLAGWRKTKLDSNWRESGLMHGGIAWLRQEVDLPQTIPARSFRFDLGLVNEQCVTAYWNGEKIGEWGKKAPEFYFGYVHFDVAPKLLKPGKNVFALRFVADTAEKSPVTRGALRQGFSDLGVTNWEEDCLVKVERQFPPLTTAALKALPAVPKGDGAHTASALFNGMIHPLIPFALKGVLWYQGESDARRAFAYRTMLPLLITDWRSRWGDDFPFIIQQLPNWNASGAANTEWAELREAQALTAKKLSNCWISVGIDLGEANNVHPRNKREIGRRLALVALANVYGKSIQFCGPVYDSMVVEGNSIRLKFKHADGLKSLDGQKLNDFTMAAADQKFLPAEARIDGRTVVVYNPKIAEPVAVRYAFINNPQGCNFSNASGLPATPFRTDNWPASTDKNK